MNASGKLPAEPLLRYVASLGGLPAIADSRDETAYDTISTVLARAAESGYLTVVAADQFACNVLNLHPCLIWPEWFDLGPFAEDTLARVVAEEKIGRFIRADEKVIALDGDPENLDPANLSVVPKAGIKNHSKHLRKLTPKQVEEIRSHPATHGGKREKGKGVVDMLAEKYGVSRHTIIDVRRKKKGRSQNYMEIGKRLKEEAAA